MEACNKLINIISSYRKTKALNKEETVDITCGVS
jgi:hypothetical protein